MDIVTWGIVGGVVAIFLVIAYFFVKMLLEYKLEMSAPSEPKGKQQAAAGFNYLDLALWDLNNMYQELLKSGLNEGQLKPVKDRIEKLEWIKKNQGVMEFALPYVDGIAKGVMKMFR